MKRKQAQPPIKDCKKKKKSQLETDDWPEYFTALFRVFKAINTVLAFVSSKRQLPTSFSSTRSSVERLLKRPLEISKVSEIKALLPDLVHFSYIASSEIDLPMQKNGLQSAADDIDYSQDANVEGGHVLTLDFKDPTTIKKSTLATQPYRATSSNMSTGAVTKLIESRNESFVNAINELMSATPPGDDAVQLLTTAGRNYLPMDHRNPGQNVVRPLLAGRPDMNDVIAELSLTHWYSDQLVHRRSVARREPITALLDSPLPEQLVVALSQARNLQSFYSHQVSAINAIRKGKHVVVSTSTASGKSIIYQVSLLLALEEDISSTAILIFPTKALAQDQMFSLQQLLHFCPGFDDLKVVTYDGDTPPEARTEIRETASVILTNFDTLHASILPNEEKWRSFLKRVKLVAVDELHYYSGLLGSHVSQVLRRFRRICAALGNRQIRFVSCSATLANPANYMANMFSLLLPDIEVICNDGAPSGRKEFLIWNPPLIDMSNPSMGRRSSLAEASNLMRFLMKKGLRVILFCKIRKVCELAMKMLKADLSNEGRADILAMVKAYRGGYTREERRKIERDAFSGQLLGIVATNALELGIDIGALDVVIMLGFPMTVSNFQQQAGRAGRRSSDSLAVLVTDSVPVDQHFVNNPADLFDNALDDLTLDLENELVLEGHLQCAAFEIPLAIEDEQWFGKSTIEICQKRLQTDNDGWYHTHPKFLPYPSQHVSIRGPLEEIYTVVETKRDRNGLSTYFTLEEVEISRALYELYEGGVFMHQGESFIVQEMLHDSKVAKVMQSDVNYITTPRDFTRVEALQTYRTRFINTHMVQFGKVAVTVKIFGFFKMKGKAIVDAVELITPPYERQTIGFWIDLPVEVLQGLVAEGTDGAAAIHAAEHAFMNQFSLSKDLKTDCRVAKEEYKDGTSEKRAPRLIFYDPVGKIGGVAARAFDNVETLLERAFCTINRCQCFEGCTSCVHSATCKDANLVSSKKGAEIIYRHLLQGRVNEQKQKMSQGS